MTKTNLRGIMQRAHEIARSCEGDYQVRLAIGLRQAWAEYRLMEIGSRWQKAGMDRIYFNDLPQWYGLELSYYKTGHISSAALNGEHISNNQAGKLGARFSGSKLWYDLNTGRFEVKGLTDELAAAVIENIRAAARVA